MISAQETNRAVAALGILRYFPSDTNTRAQIGALLRIMVMDVRALNWLVEALVNQVGEWPGPKELRGIYCTRFKPMDNIEADSTVPGFSPAEIEAENTSKTSREIEAAAVPLLADRQLPEEISPEERAEIDAFNAKLQKRFEETEAAAEKRKQDRLKGIQTQLARFP